mgnify:CR=1 FL=1
MHLTNYAINKSSADFQQTKNPQEAADGHKRSLFHVMERLRQDVNSRPHAETAATKPPTACVQSLQFRGI